MDKLFITATRNRFRFDTCRGQIDVEALWQMPLTSKDEYNLDAVAKTLNRSLKNSEEESFVTLRTTANELLTAKFEIVKFVIATKLEEAEASKNAAAVKARKEVLLNALANKEQEAILSMTPEQIKAELAKL